MGWNFDKPLYSMTNEDERNEMIRLWEKEKHGGLWSGNNRVPYPLTWLIALIIVTAFLVTMPIWGQRPMALLYVPMVEHMNDAEIQALATPEEKIARLTDIAMADHQKATGLRGATLPGLLERHPITYDDLLNIAPGIREAQTSGKYPMDYYTVLGDRIILANFEGSRREDGTPARVQPWWDKGYTIDVFYVTYFIIAMLLVCKRLPHFTHKPDMSKAG